MRFSLGILAIVFAAIECTEAVPWGGPEPTPAGELDRQGISPRPTSGPQIEVLELLKRQSTGNPRTCGFIERSPVSAITCVIGATCVFDKGASIIGCCRGGNGNCGYATSCVPYSSWTSLCPSGSATRTSPCPSNIHVDYCSLKGFGFCNTYVWPSEGVTDYECEATSSKIQSVYLAFSGLVSSIPTAGAITVQVSPVSSSGGPTTNPIGPTTTPIGPATTPVSSSGGSGGGGLIASTLPTTTGKVSGAERRMVGTEGVLVIVAALAVALL